jgi:hypothetical protein
MKNTREIGDSLEKFILSYFQEIDPKTKQSNNSGAVSNNGDILTKDFIIEAKHRNTKDVTLKSDVWRKLSSQIPIGSQKMPLYILRNEQNETFVVLDFKDFIRILKEKRNV